MSGLLLISDDPSRTACLARDLGQSHQCFIHDFYGDDVPAIAPDLIVSDIAQLTSEVIARLQRFLEPLRSEGVPFLFLMHGNAARAETQGRLLGATNTLSAASTVKLLHAKIQQLQDQSSFAIASKLVIGARQFFVQTFLSGRTITPELASTGAELVSHAVKQCGIRDWIRVVQCFDEATHQHCLIVAGLAAAFAMKLGFSVPDNYRLTEAALLHDVGKTKIPLSILNKPGRLTEDEMTVMRMHAALGYDMLVDGGFSPELLQVVRSHHEMLDGSGYPDGLRGAEIPDLVRLVTICDIFGSLIERRPYRPPMSNAAAHHTLQSMTSRLDVDLVAAFRPVMNASSPARSVPA